MSQPLSIENHAVRIEVWPRLGGKVSSIVDKADGYELLFNYPAEIPENSPYGKPYDDSWYAGWDECFPAVAAGPYPRHPYDHIPVPDHGEVYALPTVAVPTKDGVTTVWHGLRFGYRLTRKLSLTDVGLTAEYTLVNLAPFEFHFVWAMHALMSMESPVHIRLTPGAGPSMRWSHSPTGSVDRPFRWPDIEGVGACDHPGSMPAGEGWKVFTAEPVRQSASVHYPSRNRSLELSYTSDDVPAFWGLWINTGGWNRQRHFALEPTTGRFDQLDRAVADGSAGRVGAGATVRWCVSWTLRASEPT